MSEQQSIGPHGAAGSKARGPLKNIYIYYHCMSPQHCSNSKYKKAHNIISNNGESSLLLLVFFLRQYCEGPYGVKKYINRDHIIYMEKHKGVLVLLLRINIKIIYTSLQHGRR